MTTWDGPFSEATSFIASLFGGGDPALSFDQAGFGWPGLATNTLHLTHVCLTFHPTTQQS